MIDFTMCLERMFSLTKVQETGVFCGMPMEHRSTQFAHMGGECMLNSEEV